MIERKGRWIIATELGKKYGAKENYDAKRAVKYIVWEEKILNNIEIKNAVNKYKNIEIKKEENLYNTIKNETPKKQKMTQQEKEEKGKAYEEYIANFFREQGYYVWEHGKEKGRKDKSIDLLVKKGKYIYFVQCKNWENWKIDHKEVKATRTDIREYLEEKKELWQLIKDYQSKILYVTPKACLTKAAYTYIKENNEIVEYQIIPMN
ncbi:MAG: restriction endonuclease [Epsilonproteobacteria bacterium]|nr:restriction endonuclease [Campylobacterota bacterium]